MTTTADAKRVQPKEKPVSAQVAITKSTAGEAKGTRFKGKTVGSVVRSAVKRDHVATKPAGVGMPLPASLGYSALYLADPMVRVGIIRKGVPASDVGSVSNAIGYPKERLFATLRIPRATINRKVLAGELLSPEISERILGLQKLIGQVEVMVRESGNPEGFDAARWLGKWLEQECPALGGERPVDYMDTLAGQEIVSGVLAKMQSGAYA